MNPIDSIIAELEQESATTARVLERIPEGQLAWRPHEKSMSLGQLALHIASTPKEIAGIVAADTFQVDPTVFANPPQAASRSEVMEVLATSVAFAKQYLSGLDPNQLDVTCRLMLGDQQLMAMPRGAIIRSIMLNHWYHHRGQMSVYLRLLNVAVPSIYGPSADDNPFAKSAGA
jgi:uncharacterized damage-inducible protein DinB